MSRPGRERENTVDRSDREWLKRLYRSNYALMEGSQKLLDDVEGEIDKKQEDLFSDYVVLLEDAESSLRMMLKDLKVKV